MLSASIDQILKFVSNRRALELLELISEGQLDLERLDYPRSTVYATLRSLYKAGFVEKDGRVYVISVKGWTLLNMARKFSECLQTLVNMYSTFPIHRIGFPEDFLLRLHEIGDFQMAAISYSDMLKPSRRCIRYFKHTENVFGVIPSPFEDHITVLFEIADDVRFEFILRNTKQFNIKNNHIKIYRINFDPELAFIVTDSFIGITFPLMTGEFDTSRILVSESKKAIKFGKDLFEFYKAHSTRV